MKRVLITKSYLPSFYINESRSIELWTCWTPNFLNSWKFFVFVVNAVTYMPMFKDKYYLICSHIEQPNVLILRYRWQHKFLQFSGIFWWVHMWWRQHRVKEPFSWYPYLEGCGRPNFNLVAYELHIHQSTIHKERLFHCRD